MPSANARSCSVATPPRSTAVSPCIVTVTGVIFLISLRCWINCVTSLCRTAARLRGIESRRRMAHRRRLRARLPPEQSPLAAARFDASAAGPAGSCVGLAASGSGWAAGCGCAGATGLWRERRRRLGGHPAVELFDRHRPKKGRITLVRGRRVLPGLAGKDHGRAVRAAAHEIARRTAHQPALAECRRTPRRERHSLNAWAKHAVDYAGLLRPERSAAHGRQPTSQRQNSQSIIHLHPHFYLILARGVGESMLIMRGTTAYRVDLRAALW